MNEILGGGAQEQPSPPFLTPLQATEVYVGGQGVCCRVG